MNLYLDLYRNWTTFAPDQPGMILEVQSTDFTILA